ncbi:MAG: hypothetical protein V1837_08355 [Candidatus Woesearchaeota archaeon]
MIPYFPVYLFVKDEVDWRANLAKQVRSLGFRKIGIQFMAINDTELKQFPLLAKRALEFKDIVEPLFDKVLYAFHAPYLPLTRCSLEFNNKVIKNLQLIANHFPIELELVNSHLSHPYTKDWLKLHMTYKKKQRIMSRMASILRKASFDTKVTFENMPGLSPHNLHSSYIGALPSDLDFFLSSVPSLGFTFDTCHSGIFCKAISGIRTVSELPEGFYAEDFDEIQGLKKNKDFSYLSLKKDLAFVHFSDFKGLSHGYAPGKGERSKSFLSKLFKSIVSRAPANLGVLAEVFEDDYSNSPNTYETLKWMKNAG